MKLAILTPWHKTFGYDSHEDTTVLEKKMLVISHYPNLEEPTNLNDFLILYNSLLNMEQNDSSIRTQVFIAFINNISIINERMFGNISYNVMNTLHNFANKIKSKNINNSGKWSHQFRQIRGRLPTKNEVKIRSLLD